VSPRKPKTSATPAEATPGENPAADAAAQARTSTSAAAKKSAAGRKSTQKSAAAQQSELSAAAAPDATAGADTAPLTAESVRGARTLTGRVVSSKMQKTIAVEVERLIKHPAYGKYIRRTTKLLAHDESGSSREGDLVTIIPCRPMSRRKSWRLLEVVQKAAGR
jgi:small subunit ribosomal protein S17